MAKMIQSIERAANIFEYIAYNGEAGVSELSRELQLNKSTVFSILKTLEGLGYIYKNMPTDTYQTTFRVRTLADVSQGSNSFIGFARPILQVLQTKHAETVHFVKQLDDSVVYLDKLESTKSIRIHSGVGITMPMHCTGVGKAILAWRSDEEIAAYAKRTGLPSMTPNSINDLEALKEEMHRVRAQGFSIDNEENQEDLYCIGVPVFNRRGDVQYAISLSLPKYRKKDIDIAVAIADLQSTARELSAFF